MIICKSCEIKVDIKRFVAGFVLEKACDVCGGFVKTKEMSYENEHGHSVIHTMRGGCAMVETY